MEQVSVPKLNPGDIVVMDNLPAHEPIAVHAAIEVAGAELRFLAPYSPDFTPLEWPSPSSRHPSRRPPPEPSMTSRASLPKASIPSRQRNAKTMLLLPAMTADDGKML